jgi:hypothetical protein
MKKMLGLAVVSMLWGCGPQDEVQPQEMPAPEAELGQKTDALAPDAKILGRWFYGKNTGFVVDVNTTGDGLRWAPTLPCWHLTRVWRYIAFKSNSTDGGSIFYTGQAGAGSGTCGVYNYSSANFTLDSANTRLRVDYLNGTGYYEIFIR